MIKNRLKKKERGNVRLSSNKYSTLYNKISFFGNKLNCNFSFMYSPGHNFMLIKDQSKSISFLLTISLDINDMSLKKQNIIEV